ncbi:hypothetical protein NA57DRAFT_72225 [Rhizodiscina lignyota]|uniref:Uncharacterized protein n=1 Tax=Rhizodiscina lignyota TaxID=1504668 RepID=A0A9P4IPE9_9PEZI|nr:hypothetical protein NA57DRAFT_72225 [Rhizodiscina lignyota]
MEGMPAHPYQIAQVALPNDAQHGQAFTHRAPLTDAEALHNEVQFHNWTREQLRQEMYKRVQTEQQFGRVKDLYKKCLQDLDYSDNHLRQCSMRLEEGEREIGRLNQMIADKTAEIYGLHKEMAEIIDYNDGASTSLPTATTECTIATPRSKTEHHGEPDVMPETGPPTMRRSAVPSPLILPPRLGQLRLPTPRP